MLENREQLEQVLRGRLGAAFARHAYGMRRWVDVFSARVPQIEDPYLTEFVNQMTRINHGRAFFATPERLGDYILVDYVKTRVLQRA